MKTSVVAALLLAAATLPAAAQSGPTPQEQMACRSDAGKFCAEHIGKPPQMNACLRENKSKLSDACRKVVESHGG
jgi:Cysteine rich repeat